VLKIGFAVVSGPLAGGDLRMVGVGEVALEVDSPRSANLSCPVEFGIDEILGTAKVKGSE
jgi:hypothetical protein